MSDPDILKNGNIDFLSVVVDRKDVERCDPGPVLQVLGRLLQDRQTVERFRGRVEVAFYGYDDDPRELYEIQQVRGFVSELDKKFPFWLYFLNLSSGTLVLVLLCLCQYSLGPNRMLIPDKIGMAKFLDEHYVAVNWLFETYNLDEKDNEALTAQVTDYFEQRSKGPLVQ